jgi:hypothetical protein
MGCSCSCDMHLLRTYTAYVVLYAVRLMLMGCCAAVAPWQVTSVTWYDP